MKKIIVFIIFGIILLFVITNKTETFADTITQLTDEDMYQLKQAIDKVADKEYLNAKNQIGTTYLEMIISIFGSRNKDVSIEKQKEAFNSYSVISAFYKNESLSLSENFKQSLFTDLVAAVAINNTLDTDKLKHKLLMVPLRLYSSDKITSNENMKKIRDASKLNVSDFFVKYLLEFYDNSQPAHKPNEKINRFNDSTPTAKYINDQKSTAFFN